MISRPCLEPNCPTLVRRGRCALHTAERAARLVAARRAVPATRVYDDPRWRRARAAAIERAGGRCQALEHELRCPSTTRLVGHHDYPGGVDAMLRDGANPFDLRWIVVLCHRHHQQVEAWLRRNPSSGR